MGSIIAFATSSVLLAGFLALKVWEQSAGKTFAGAQRAAFDAWVVRCARVAKDAPPKFSTLCWCAVRDLAARVRTSAPRAAAAIRTRVSTLYERIRARKFSAPRMERGEASEFLKNVTEHRNGIRNGDTH